MGPFIKNEDHTSRMMLRVIVALIPIIVFSFYKNGVMVYDGNNIFEVLYPLIFIFISTLATFLFETIYQLIFNKNKNLKDIICNSYAYMPGIFLGLILPINTPISVLLVGAFSASILGKMLFGGFGKNIFNPALIGRLIVISTYALVITENGGYFNSYELDTISGATPLSNASLIDGIGTYKQLVEPYGNLWNFFIGTIPGAVGETSSLLCIIAFIYLALTKTIKWRIPVFYVLTVFLMSLGIGLYNDAGIWYALFQIFSGGLMFGAVFMATDPVTSPVTKPGQIIYGLALGLLTVTLRYLTPYPEGVLTSILTMNMFVFMIDDLGVKVKTNVKKIILPISLIIIAIIAMTFVIGEKNNVSTVKGDPNFEIISKEESSNITRYIVTEQSYGGKIKIEVVIENDNVISFEVLEQNDSYYGKIESVNYIDKLLEEQNDLENCDTVSGATVSSTALKKALINTLNDYRGE